MLCPGCGHRGLFYALQRLNAAVFGDIGCYTLGGAAPLLAMQTCGCMGASVGVVQGIDRVGVKDRTVAVIGDSTFFHSGVAPLISLYYNNSPSTTIIVDNRVTAMTGHQENPGTGKTLQNAEAPIVKIDELVRGIGIKKVDIVNPYDFKNVMNTIKDHVQSQEPSVIIAQYPCVLKMRERKPAPVVDVEKCNECGNCIRIGCSPISKVDGGISINTELCNGCGFCATICSTGAIGIQGKEGGIS